MARATSITTIMTMPTPDTNTSKLRLLQLVSPSLPVGAFAYSQGLEWAVEAGWVEDEATTATWCRDVLGEGICPVDVPILVRMMEAFQRGDCETLEHWNATLLAMRETRELRDEETVRGRAMLSLLQGLEVDGAASLKAISGLTQLCAFAAAASSWKLSREDAATGYVWSWLENALMAAIKLVPLGQLAGQRLMLGLSDAVTDAVQTGLELDDEEIGGSLPGLAIASCLHETQYSRLFRS